MPCQYCHKKKASQVKFRQGNVYALKGNGTRYILAQVDYKKFALISLDSGNRWSEPVDDISKVTANQNSDFIVVRENAVR